MREPLLRRNPEFDEVTLNTLVGVAHAVEQESARRYASLAQAMRERNEAATAQAFEAMRQEELAHIDAVRHWAEGLGAAVPPVAEFDWRLPPELSQSWDEVAGSALLTPYRAFAIAALNEQRAFALYSYLSAQATDPTVAAQAERLALEELRHASLMRRWRRQAWHDERRDQAPPPPTVSTERELASLAAQHEAAIDQRLVEVIARLREASDDACADALAAMRKPTNPSAAGHAAASVRPNTPVALLNAAQEPLEAYSEALERILEYSEGDLFSAAEAALADVVRRLALIGRLIEERRRS